jgi:SAM-dependent methyltransferase
MTTTFDWSAVAAGWDRYRDRAEQAVGELTARVLATLAPQPGERLLELGAGTGELARRLAAAVGPTGSVLATDAAAGMVALCERTLADLPHAAVAQVDAAGTGLPDHAFDAAAFVMGLMFVVEQEKAAHEVRRVLRPGGRAVVSTWAAPQHNPWLVGVGMAAAMNGVVAGGPPVEPGGLFSLGEADRLRAVLEAGGLQDVTVEEVPLTVRYADADTWFDTVSALAGPLSAALASRPDAIAAVRATAHGFVAPYLSDEGLALPGLALLATARA